MKEDCETSKHVTKSLKPPQLWHQSQSVIEQNWIELDLSVRSKGKLAKAGNELKSRLMELEKVIFESRLSKSNSTGKVVEMLRWTIVGNWTVFHLNYVSGDEHWLTLYSRRLRNIDRQPPNPINATVSSRIAIAQQNRVNELCNWIPSKFHNGS